MVSVLCQKRFLHLLVLHFPPLTVTINPGGGEKGLLHTVIAAAVCYVPGRYTVADGDAGDVMVAAVIRSLQTPAGAALRIVPH